MISNVRVLSNTEHHFLHRMLEKNLDKVLNGRTGVRFFFPLCGKAIDMKWYDNLKVPSPSVSGSRDLASALVVSGWQIRVTLWSAWRSLRRGFSSSLRRTTWRSVRSRYLRSLEPKCSGWVNPTLPLVLHSVTCLNLWFFVCLTAEPREEHLLVPVRPVPILQVRSSPGCCGSVPEPLRVTVPPLSSIAGRFGAIWDRGSLVAINPKDREK